MKPLLIRADASTAMGTGHIMRCLALAQVWQDAGGDVTFLMAEATPAIEERLKTEGMYVLREAVASGSTIDAESTAGLANRIGVEWVVVDGEQFDRNYLSKLSVRPYRILLIDDYASRPAAPVHMILNMNTGATEHEYRNREPSTRLLRGESFALLRREFTARPHVREIGRAVKRLLVTLGGSDPDDLSPRIAGALCQLNGVEIVIVTGYAYQRLSELTREHPTLRVVANASDMASQIADSDLAIIIAGGTLWELLYMQCVVVSYSRNQVQERVLNLLDQKGAVRSLGNIRNFDEDALLDAVIDLAESTDKRVNMAKMGRTVIDGIGADRVLHAMQARGDA